jgi:hypothetical protein
MSPLWIVWQRMLRPELSRQSLSSLGEQYSDWTNTTILTCTAGLGWMCRRVVEGGLGSMRSSGDGFLIA